MKGRVTNVNVALSPNGGDAERTQDDELVTPGFKF